MTTRKWPVCVVQHLHRSLSQKQFDSFCGAFIRHSHLLSDRERVRVMKDFGTLMTNRGRYWGIGSGCPFHDTPHPISIKIVNIVVTESINRQ